MIKKMSKIITLSLVMSILMVTMLGITAFAASSYTSTISLSSRSSVTGAYRDYTGSTHKIDVKLSWRNWETTGSNYADFQLQKKTILSYTVQGTKTLNLQTIGQTYPATYSGQTNGTFRYFIHNGYPMTDYKHSYVDSWSSDLVTMSSN